MPAQNPNNADVFQGGEAYPYASGKVEGTHGQIFQAGEAFPGVALRSDTTYVYASDTGAGVEAYDRFSKNGLFGTGGSGNTDTNDTDAIVVQGNFLTNNIDSRLRDAYVYTTAVMAPGATQPCRIVVFADTDDVIGSGVPSTTNIYAVSDEFVFTHANTVAGGFVGPITFSNHETLPNETKFYYALWFGPASGDHVTVAVTSPGTTVTPQYYNLSTTYHSTGNPVLSGGWTNSGFNVGYVIYLEIEPYAAQLGNTNPIGTNVDSTSTSGTIVGTGPFFTDQVHVRITDIQMYHTSTGAASQKVRLGIFKDTNGVPDPNPIAMSDERTFSSSTPGNTWQTFTFTSPPDLLPVTGYWVVIWWDTAVGGTPVSLRSHPLAKPKQYYSLVHTYVSTGDGGPVAWLNTAGSPQDYAIYLDLAVVPSSTPISGTDANGTTTETATVTQQFVHDTFTDTNGTTVDAHTGEIGATWTVHPSAGAGSQMSIGNNRIRSSGAGGTIPIYYASGTFPSADYTVEGIFRQLDTTTTVIAMYGRMDTAAWTGYRVAASAFSGNWLLSKFVAGTQTDLGNYVGSFATGVDYDVKLEMIGSTINVYIDGVLRITATDSAVTAAGRVAVQGFDSYAIGQGWQIDLINGFAPPPAVTPVSSSDTGSDTETPVLTAAYTATDTGTDTESPTLTAAYTSADTATDSETGLPVATYAVVDTGTSTETALVTVPISGTDTGTDSESATLTAAYSIVDTNTTVETPTETATYSQSDTGTSTESGTISFATVDTGTDTETFTLTAQITDSDSATADEPGIKYVFPQDAATSSEVAILTVAITTTDTGTDTETTIPTYTVLDNGTSVETPALVAALSSSDTGTASEAATVDVGVVHVSDADTGSGIDAVAAYSAAIPASDSNSTTETSSSSATISAADVCIGSEAAILTAALNVLDTATGSETFAGISITVGDFGTGIDTGFISNPIASDSGVGIDVPDLHAYYIELDTGTGTENGRKRTGTALLAIEVHAYAHWSYEVVEQTYTISAQKHVTLVKSRTHYKLNAYRHTGNIQKGLVYR